MLSILKMLNLNKGMLISSFNRLIILMIFISLFGVLYLNKGKIECSIYKSIAYRASELNDYNKAEKYYKKVIYIAEKSKKYSQAYFMSLNNLGSIYDKQEKYSEAESLFVKALNIPRNNIKEEYYIAETSYNLGSLYTDIGKYNKAEILLKQAILIKRKICGTNNQGYADYLSSLGSLYLKQGRFKEAEQVLKQSLTIVTNLSDNTGEDISGILINLGMTYLYQDKDIQAEDSLKKALQICQKSKCSNTILGEISSNLGIMYIKQKKLSKAESFFKQSLNTYKFTGINSKISLAEYNLAKLYIFERKYKDALPLLKEALTFSRKSMGNDSIVAIKIQKDLKQIENFVK